MIFERVDDSEVPSASASTETVASTWDPTCLYALRPDIADVPHDLVHFVVEEQAELRLWGSMDKSPRAETAVDSSLRPHATDTPLMTRSGPTRIGRAGRPDVAVSERLAALARLGSIEAGAESDSVTVLVVARRAINQRLKSVLDEWQATPHGGRSRPRLARRAHDPQRPAPLTGLGHINWRGCRMGLVEDRALRDRSLRCAVDGRGFFGPQIPGDFGGRTAFVWAFACACQSVRVR